MNNQFIFKSYITTINRENETTSQKNTYGEMLFRIINIDDTYFIAEEISSGCIFPTYAFGNKQKSRNDGNSFNKFCPLSFGKYFIYIPVYHEDNILKYSVSYDELQLADFNEVNEYLKEKEKNTHFQRIIHGLELANGDVNELEMLKKTVKLIKNRDNVSSTNNSNIIDLSEISDLGYDMSNDENLCDLIGRNEEIKRIIKNICIRKKSTILVGPSGAGKTSIVEKLALDIKEQKSNWLNDKIIFYLNTSMLQSNTKYRGEFEEKINKLINFCKSNKNTIILFIDEIHTLYKLGSSDNSSIDAMNILKPYISKGDITIIGATTEDEYIEYLTKDPAFLSRCERVNISLPDKELNIQIILSYIEELERKYQVKLSLSNNDLYCVIDFIISLTDVKNQRVVGDIKISNPRLAKDIFENAFVESIFNDKNHVSIEELCFAILDCDRISQTIRKEKVIELRKILVDRKKEVNKTLKKELIKAL